MFFLTLLAKKAFGGSALAIFFEFLTFLIFLMNKSRKRKKKKMKIRKRMGKREKSVAFFPLLVFFPQLP